ncbi:estradiol 17-beta-dehydrogenase 11 isoform X1 [Phlebotomus papatasi]|uniref:estradiol 17-beta-dehydrogenase 11 isoform X1 n=2 Tax=Phlebotomus papatasi TaxID=29031 RepID=UPI0024841A6E|nr:estradiol 17-beta-dehydrogenase 11 isoform X1 [Phlebotomus papatasi]
MTASSGKHLTSQASNGKSPSTSSSEATNMLRTAIYTIVDVIVFLLVSLGYCIQDWYFIIFGMPKKSLKGELALVTGGGGGLGRLLALRLVRAGASVVLWDINPEGLDETTKLVQSIGGYCKSYVVDISKREEVYKAADQMRNEIGDVTILINNAGVVSGRVLLDTPDHLIERSFNVNVMAHFWTAKAFLPQMLESNHGHIVTIASLAGQVGISKLVDYCSSKFAAVGFDEAIRLELEFLGAKGVHTTCICPYFIQATGMFDDVYARWVPTLKSEDVADRIIAAIRRNEKLAIVPSYLRFMLALKWIFPWGCTAGFLKRLVPDASPQHSLHATEAIPIVNNNASGKSKINGVNSQLSNNNDIKAVQTSPHLVHRVSVGERVH